MRDLQAAWLSQTVLFYQVGPGHWQGSRVLDVTPERTQAAAEAALQTLTVEQRQKVRAVAADPRVIDVYLGVERAGPDDDIKVLGGRIVVEVGQADVENIAVTMHRAIDIAGTIVVEGRSDGLPADAHPGIHGGWIAVIHHYPSEMAQNFWTAIWAFCTCIVMTILISLLTKPRPEEELRGLVYALTPRPKDEEVCWYQRPASLAVIVAILLVGLNLIFW